MKRNTFLAVLFLALFLLMLASPALGTRYWENKEMKWKFRWENFEEGIPCIKQAFNGELFNDIKVERKISSYIWDNSERKNLKILYRNKHKQIKMQFKECLTEADVEEPGDEVIIGDEDTAQELIEFHIDSLDQLNEQLALTGSEIYYNDQYPQYIYFREGPDWNLPPGNEVFYLGPFGGGQAVVCATNNKEVSGDFEDYFMACSNPKDVLFYGLNICESNKKTLANDAGEEISCQMLDNEGKWYAMISGAGLGQGGGGNGEASTIPFISAIAALVVLSIYIVFKRRFLKKKK
jgi:hypothetical protein